MMEAEETHKFVPTMTIEPLSPIMGHIAGLLQLLAENQFLISRELADIIVDAEMVNVVTDLPYELASMDMTL
jgi:hypothetical protein